MGHRSRRLAAGPAHRVAVLLYELAPRPNRWLVPFLLVVVLGDKLITNGIKELADRARPDAQPGRRDARPVLPERPLVDRGLVLRRARADHGAGRGARARALLAGTAGGIAAAVAASRVLLDVHWLSDVIAGVMLGWAWFALCASRSAVGTCTSPSRMERAAARPSTPPRRAPRPPAAKV